MVLEWTGIVHFRLGCSMCFKAPNPPRPCSFQHGHDSMDSYFGLAWRQNRMRVFRNLWCLYDSPPVSRCYSATAHFCFSGEKGKQCLLAPFANVCHTAHSLTTHRKRTVLHTHKTPINSVLNTHQIHLWCCKCWKYCLSW